MATNQGKFSIKREHTGNRQLDEIQHGRNEIGTVLNACPFVRGRLVSVSFVAGTPKVVNHKLGTPAACIVVRLNYDGIGAVPGLIESPSQTDLDPNTQIRLGSSTACTVDLWFYPRASLHIDSSGQSP